MELSYVDDVPRGGFNYDNCLRNKALLEAGSKGKQQLQYTKTGTTICGCVFNVSFNCSKKLLINLCRTVLCSLLIRERLPVPLWLTKTAPSCITWLLTFTALVPERPLIATTSLR